MTYEEWLGEKLVPCRIGRFFISAPWERLDFKVKPHAGEFSIALDPGVVFGTGTHPTTRECLDFMERAFRESSIETVLDLGTGTGLLAIAAAKLGALKTLAVDF
ncbi:MAG: 50S ribosomal protein L11 methyltransferase, partial [Sneathiellales bacterium]|nr:50S ribosomal protein L11 methyltransferase [Sneathiellales bacterium]